MGHRQARFRSFIMADVKALNDRVISINGEVGFAELEVRGSDARVCLASQAFVSQAVKGRKTGLFHDRFVRCKEGVQLDGPPPFTCFVRRTSTVPKAGTLGMQPCDKV